MKKGITLIELLIVIAIIAILAAIAVPNFLEAQTRAKVSRVKADQRSLATGLEAYYVDNNNYPAWTCRGTGGNPKLDATGGPGCSMDWGTGPLGHANAFSGSATGAASIHSFRVHTAAPWTGTANLFFMLTTPISYVTNFFPDPFADTKGSTYGYYSQKTGWIVYSFGPDVDESGATGIPQAHGEIDYYVETLYNYRIAQPTITLITGQGQGTALAYTYDPSNGTGSAGDVYRVKQ